MSITFEDTSVVVLGCGNIFYGDDAFGILAIKALGETETDIPAHVRVVDAGTGGPKIVSLLNSYDHPPDLIVVDAARLGMPVGNISVLSNSELPNDEVADSSHGMRLGDELCNYRGICHLVLFEPYCITYGTSISSYAYDAVEEACRCICSLIRGDVQ